MRERDMPAREIAELVFQLPGGCRVAKAIGGFWAWSDETAAQVSQSFLIRQIWHAYTGGKGTPPKPPEAPKGWLVERQEQEQAAQSWQDKAAAWKRDNAELLEQYRQNQQLTEN